MKKNKNDSRTIKTDLPDLYFLEEWTLNWERILPKYAFKELFEIVFDIDIKFFDVENGWRNETPPR